MTDTVKVEFKKGWVDEKGGVWLAGMSTVVSAETAKALIAEGAAVPAKAEPKPASTPPKE